MGIIQNIRDGLARRRIQRLKGDLTVIANERNNFNPFAVMVPSSIVEKDKRSVQLVEAAVWQSGSIQALRDFYKNYPVSASNEAIAKTNFFYAVGPDNVRHVTAKFANGFSNRMAIIEMGQGFSIDCTVYGESVDKAIDKKKSQHATNLLNDMMEDIRLNDICYNSAADKSWSGHICWKLSYDITLTNYPILECVDATRFELVKERGIVKAIDFITWIDRYAENPEKNDKRRYKLIERYTVNEQKMATIIQSAFEVKDKGVLLPINLASLPETVKYMDPKSMYKTNDGGMTAYFTFEGLKGMLAFDLPNLLSRSIFQDNIYGHGDLWGSESLLDALDEIVSEIVAEIRSNKNLRFYPEDMVPKDEEGKLKSGWASTIAFIGNFIQTKSNMDQEAKLPETVQFTDKTDEHIAKYKAIIGQLAASGGVSVISLGIPGMESIDSSDKSTRERTRTTQETRQEKLKLWKPFIINALVQYMTLASWMQAQKLYTPEPSELIDVDYHTIDVNITFPDLIVDSLQERANICGTAKTSRIMSTEAVIDYLHPDWSEEDKIAEVNRIKIEDGLSLQNPELLQLKTPTTETGEEDKGTGK